MKKIILTLFLMLFFVSIAFATVERIIDPEIPIASELVNYEENFDDVIVSALAVAFLSFGAISGTIITFLLIFFIIKGIPIF